MGNLKQTVAGAFAALVLVGLVIAITYLPAGIHRILTPLIGIGAVAVAIFCFANVTWHCWQGLGKRVAFWRDQFPGHEQETIRLWVLTLVDLIAKAAFGFIFLGFAYFAFFVLQ